MHQRVPDAWKISKITPIFKSEDPTNVSNYRPISVLSTVSKLLEKTLNNQIINYLESNNLLTDCQHGFRPKRSTMSALLLFTEQIRVSLKNSHTVGAVFIDFRKAFDTVNHQILQNKLHSLKFSPKAIQLINSYLSDRTQVVKVGDATSTPLSCPLGVPQGSILGPLLFLIYINDLPLAIRYSQTLLYADDTVIFASGQNPDVINHKLNSDLQSLDKWLQENHLTINVRKTECMYYYSAQRQLLLNNPLVIADQKLSVVSTYKYLGVTLDTHLTYGAHVQKLTTKLNQKLFVYTKIRPYLSLSVSRMYLHAVVLSTLSYCLPVWTLTTQEILEPVARLYNRTYKIHHRLPGWTHHCTALSLSGALTFQNYTLSHGLKFYYSLQNSCPSAALSAMVPRPRSGTGPTTRSTTNQHLPKQNFKNSYGKRSFFYELTESWNSLPLSMRTIHTDNLFKKTLSKHLSDGYRCSHR